MNTSRNRPFHLIVAIIATFLLASLGSAQTKNDAPAAAAASAGMPAKESLRSAGISHEMTGMRIELFSVTGVKSLDSIDLAAAAKSLNYDGVLEPAKSSDFWAKPDVAAKSLEIKNAGGFPIALQKAIAKTHGETAKVSQNDAKPAKSPTNGGAGGGL